MTAYLLRMAMFDWLRREDDGREKGCLREKVIKIHPRKGGRGTDLTRSFDTHPWKWRVTQDRGKVNKLRTVPGPRLPL